MIYNIRLAAAAFAGLSLTAVAAPKFEEMDYGRFITTSFDNTKGQNTLKGSGCTVNKGMAIQLGEKEGCMLFDTDLCRWAGGWTGGYITYKGVIFDGAHGPNASATKGANLVFETNPTPTWSKGASFADPRPLAKGDGAAKVPFGPLPKDWVKFKGSFVSGDNVVVAYTVGTASLLEMPALEKAGDTTLITRTVNIIAAGAGAENILWQGADAPSVVGKHIAVVRSLDTVTVITVLGSADSELAVSENRVVWKIPAFTAGTAFKVAYAKGALADEAQLIAAAKSAAKPSDLRAFTKGGAQRWKETVTTKLITGTPAEQDAYVVDTIEVPFTNPYKAWMRIGAFDFMRDGRIVVGTWSGDVWMISDINTAPKWQRIATGLFQALGVKVVDEKIYIHGREGITRLNDLNGDGEVDFYENFNNDIQTTPGFHEFAFDLQTDSKGNFIFSKGGPVNSGGRGFQPYSAHAGTILRLSPDGQKLDVFATGVRAPNGISVGPGDVVTTGDNEGSWVPRCYVHIVKEGECVTVADLAHMDTKPTKYSPHICYMPKDVDNSGGGQVWVGKNWGLAEGTLLHLSYGTCSLYGVMQERVDGIVQGGVYKFPLKFESGTMRGRFSPLDGQLYISGLKGWQSSAAKDGSLQRVRYTGKPVTFPAQLNVKPNGVNLAFTTELDATAAADATNYSVQQWNYKWSNDYGSAEYKLDGTKGKDAVEVKSAKLSADKKSVFLDLGSVVPVEQMEIKFNVKSASGAAIPGRIINTINAVPKI